jgi:hypothetical protein
MMRPTVVHREKDEKPDGSRYEMVAWLVPVSEDFPKGLKYSFQYMDADGDTLLRYDNAPHHLDVDRHHRHPPERHHEAGVHRPLRPDRTEVNEIYEQRTD